MIAGKCKCSFFSIQIRAYELLYQVRLLALCDQFHIACHRPAAQIATIPRRALVRHQQILGNFSAVAVAVLHHHHHHHH